MAEGRLEADYAEGRSVYLEKPGLWTDGKEIRETKEDKDAIQAVMFFRRFDVMGMPYGPWANAPNTCVEIIEALAPLRDLYKPRLF